MMVGEAPLHLVHLTQQRLLVLQPGGRFIQSLRRIRRDRYGRRIPAPFFDWVREDERRRRMPAIAPA